jgi:hypothetical protein
MELLLVLIMLSIVVSIGLLVVNITRSNFNTLNSNNTALIDIQNNDMKLNSFFFNSDILFFDEESKILSSEGKNTFILEGEKIIDVLKDEILFDSISEIKIKLFRNKNNKMILNSFSFSKKIESQVLPFSYIKQYDIATRIKYPYKDSLIIK